MEMKDEHKQAFWIVGFGAIGGILSCVYCAVVGSPIDPWYLKVPASMLLGAGASFVGAYLLANPDLHETRGLIRGLAFAMMCGFAWKPVYDAGSALVEQAVKNRNDQPILSQAQASEEQVAELAKAGPSELPARIAETKATALALIGDVQKAQDPETKRKVRRSAEKLIQSLANPAPADDPNVEEARLEALKEVGQKAADEKDMTLFQTTVRRMAGRPWSPSTKQAASMAARQLAEQVNLPGVPLDPHPAAPPP